MHDGGAPVARLPVLEAQAELLWPLPLCMHGGAGQRICLSAAHWLLVSGAQHVARLGNRRVWRSSPYAVVSWLGSGRLALASVC